VFLLSAFQLSREGLDYVPAGKLGAELFFDVISTTYERTNFIKAMNTAPELNR
jgi:hypothetical protein